MLVLVFINVSLRFYQEYGSSKAAMKLSEFVRCPVKVQRGAGRVVQTELCVRVDQRDVPGDIVIFVPGDLFPGVVRLLTSKHLVIRSHDHILLLEQSIILDRGVWNN
ncbi:uncharacterized protein LOC114307209 isoform X2 [Camellia sinensis]|uniref:uncharacterized protein LOC114307209 isoform X2 n=1 Tax=Camellia sinensis TaxID=4442 RepID=UPI001036C445|nr:uncharacterized protein LOC114307209 isoform X2 [Camellia sinensis]